MQPRSSLDKCSHSKWLAMGALAEEEEPGARARDPRKRGLGLLCAIPLHRADMYIMFVFYLFFLLYNPFKVNVGPVCGEVALSPQCTGLHHCTSLRKPSYLAFVWVLGPYDVQASVSALLGLKDMGMQ